MTEKPKSDVPRDVDWERAQSTIRARILAMREKQASDEKTKDEII